MLSGFDAVKPARGRFGDSMARGIVEVVQECFPKHLGGNSKNKIWQDTEEDGKKRRVIYEKKFTGHEQKSRRPNYISGLSSLPRRYYSPKQWMNYIAIIIIVSFWQATQYGKKKNGHQRKKKSPLPKLSQSK